MQPVPCIFIQSCRSVGYNEKAGYREEAKGSGAVRPVENEGQEPIIGRLGRVSPSGSTEFPVSWLRPQIPAPTKHEHAVCLRARFFVSLTASKILRLGKAQTAFGSALDFSYRWLCRRYSRSAKSKQVLFLPSLIRIFVFVRVRRQVF